MSSLSLQGRTLMVTDHQGHKEIKASSSPTPSSSSFPSSPHELFVLTDPAIHLIPEEGKYPILDDMSHPLDGNRRKYGVREFASRHVCSHICIGLGLNPK